MTRYDLLLAWAEELFDERYIDIFRSRCLTYPDPPETYDEIGRRWGISRSRVSQIQRRCERILNPVISRIMPDGPENRAVTVVSLTDAAFILGIPSRLFLDPSFPINPCDRSRGFTSWRINDLLYAARNCPAINHRWWTSRGYRLGETTDYAAVQWWAENIFGGFRGSENRKIYEWVNSSTTPRADVLLGYAEAFWPELYVDVFESRFLTNPPEPREIVGERHNVVSTYIEGIELILRDKLSNLPWVLPLLCGSVPISPRLLSPDVLSHIYENVVSADPIRERWYPFWTGSEYTTPNKGREKEK